MSKEKSAVYGGIFLMFMGLLLLGFNFFDKASMPDFEKLKTADGVVQSLHYKDHFRNPVHDLYITLSNSQKQFHITNVSKLKEHNGCHLTSLQVGDKIKIFYTPNGYTYFKGEENDIWKIESKEKVIVSAENILFLLNSERKIYFREAFIFIFMGFLLFIAPFKMPWLLMRR